MSKKRTLFWLCSLTALAGVLLSAAAVVLPFPWSLLLFLAGTVVLGLFLWAVFAPNASFFIPVFSRGRTKERLVALTFDDGPYAPYTCEILDVLAQEQVKATFFVLGRHVEDSPHLVQRMDREGHCIANHGFDHRLLPLCSPGQIERQLLSTHALLTPLCGEPPILFRAPHGWKSPFLGRILRRHGYRLIGWSKGVFDTAMPGSTVITGRCLKALNPGAILLLHDGIGAKQSGDRSQTVQALPAFIAAAHKAGYRFVTVPDLVAGE